MSLKALAVITAIVSSDIRLVPSASLSHNNPGGEWASC